MSPRTSSLCSHIFLVLGDHWLYVCLHLKMEFLSCIRGRQWCDIFHYHWWTASIKPRLLFSHSGLVSWGLPFLQFGTYYQTFVVGERVWVLGEKCHLQMQDNRCRAANIHYLWTVTTCLKVVQQIIDVNVVQKRWQDLTLSDTSLDHNFVWRKTRNSKNSLCQELCTLTSENVRNCPVKPSLPCFRKRARKRTVSNAAFWSRLAT